MTEFHLTGSALRERMNRAVEKVRERLENTARTLRDVDILLRRSDLPAAIEAMQGAGFVYRHSAEIDMFLDNHDSKARDAVRVLLACERVHATDLMAAPDVDDSVVVDSHRTLSLAALVRMKLNVFRRKDQMHLIDMLDVGLIDASWVRDLPPELASRLQELLDNPE